MVLVAVAGEELRLQNVRCVVACCAQLGSRGLVVAVHVPGAAGAGRAARICRTVSSTVQYYSTGTGTSTSSTLAIITKQRSFPCTGTNVLVLLLVVLRIVLYHYQY